MPGIPRAAARLQRLPFRFGLECIAYRIPPPVSEAGCWLSNPELIHESFEWQQSSRAGEWRLG